MSLLWIAIALFIAWIIFWAVVKVVAAGFWILLGFAVAFLIVHLFVHKGSKRSTV